MRNRIAATVVTLALAGCAGSQVPVHAEGGILVDAEGMTVYTFDRDAVGKSVCNGPCAANWPPVEAAADARKAGDYSVVKREDGGKQWAYKGKPLYRWSKDRQPGDRGGDGVNNLWRVARP